MSNLTVITDEIFALRDGFIAVASDPGINFDKEAGFAVQVLSANDYALSVALSNRESVRNAVTNVAAIGISLNPAKKQAYLVPRKVAGKAMICLDISYMGLIDLAIATGSILWAKADLVREHDTFVLNGFDKPPTHAHDPFAGAEARGAIKGAYVVVKTCDGEYLTHTMDIGAIFSVRDRSESWKAYVAKKSKGDYANPGPWGSDEGEMIKKTVVKQAYKYWPKTSKTDRVDNAIQMLNTEGEGFAADQKPSFPGEELQAWVSSALAAKTEADLKAIWQSGLAVIRASKDMAAYEAFKATVTAHGKALKNAPTDVVDKNEKAAAQAVQAASEQAPEMTLAKVMDMLTKAKNRDALDVAADWIGGVKDPAHRAELSAKYDALIEIFNK